MSYDIISVDLDGTLCDANKVPCTKTIARINKLYNTKDKFIVIHTSRNHNMYVETVNWLNKHNVLFNAICMNKMKADLYIDDRNEIL